MTIQINSGMVSGRKSHEHTSMTLLFCELWWSGPNWQSYTLLPRFIYGYNSQSNCTLFLSHISSLSAYIIRCAFRAKNDHSFIPRADTRIGWFTRQNDHKLSLPVHSTLHEKNWAFVFFEQHILKAYTLLPIIIRLASMNSSYCKTYSKVDNLNSSL